MSARKVTLAALLMLVLGVLAAGCGDSEESGSGESNGAAASATKGPALDGDPLRVGVMCACSGPAAGTAGGIPQLVDAWEKYTNDNGGINGHPVEAILVDTKNDPAATVTQAKKLIDQDKVQAIVAADYQGTAYAKLASKAGVPITGGNYADQVFTSDPIFFPSGTTTPVFYYGMVSEAKALGKTKFGVMACAELPPCAGVSGLVEALAGIVGGVEVVSSAKVSATAPNYTAQCAQAKDAGADVGLVAHSSDVIVRVADQCAQQGWKPLHTNYSSTVSANWLTTPSLDGAVTIQGNAPLGTDDTPGMKRFNEAMDQNASKYKESNQYGEVSINQWSGLELFKKAAENAKMDASSTGEDTQKGLYAMKDETLDGISPPLNFVKGQPTAFVPCYFVQGIKGGEYTAPKGSEPTCVPEDEIGKIGEVLAAAAG